MNNKVTCKRLRPNPIFEEWLTKMYAEARSTNSSLAVMLKEALESLIKYPLPLKSGAECIILKGFNKRLCAYIDKLLKANNNHASHNEVIVLVSDSPTPDPSSLPHSEDAVETASNSQASNRSPCVNLTELPKLPSNPDTVSIQHTQVNNVPDLNTTSSITTKNTIKGKEKVKKTIKKTQKYRPAHRSGGYAILIALLEQSLENPHKAFLTKEELIEKAQKHSEESFVRPKPYSYYTAWSSMTILQKKGLVKKEKNKKAEYMLSEEGMELARKILEDAKSMPTVNDIIFNSIPWTSSTVNQNADNATVNEIPSTSTDNVTVDYEMPSTSADNVTVDDAIPSPSADNVTVSDEIPSTSADINVIEMAPGTFDIILLIDKNETGGLSKKNDPTVEQFKKFPDLKHDYKSLKVGDFTWIAKHKVNQDQELVLPYIVERKRMDDLGASIKDGRFHEQKFRLRKCGIDNVLYLVENYGKNKNVGLPLQSLMQALANTRVQDGFKVHVTDSLTNTTRFLAMLTKRLTIRYQNTRLRGWNADPQGDKLMTFDHFIKSTAKSKPLTVTETFIKLLLQLKGVSVEKALAITKKYPTPRSLINAYVKCDRKEGEILLAHLKYGAQYRKVGPTASKSIYQLFSSSGAD